MMRFGEKSTGMIRINFERELSPSIFGCTNLGFASAPRSSLELALSIRVYFANLFKNPRGPCSSTHFCPRFVYNVYCVLSWGCELLPWICPEIPHSFYNWQFYLHFRCFLNVCPGPYVIYKTIFIIPSFNQLPGQNPAFFIAHFLHIWIFKA
jgi:hypothetical protein